jgi:predicted RNA-binding Zn ribbon-like protein
MTAERPPAIFIADSVGLDFLNSIAHPGGKAVDWLAHGEDLLAWLDRAGLIPPQIAAGFARGAVPGELDAVAAQARALREWFRGFVVAHKGRALREDALQQLAPLNQVLARDEAFGQIAGRAEGRDQPSASGLVWQTQRRWRSPDALLLPIAHAMADVVCSDDFSRVKTCGGHGCTLMFMDRTRGNARRWCSMAVCGNRMKQAAHRTRVHPGR